MIQRYTAFLSKLWFSKADPFLKAKYEHFFQDSEHRWGPNMIFKNIEKNYEKIKHVKTIMERKLNKENKYQSRALKDEHKSPRGLSNVSGKSTCDEDYEKFLQLRHKDICAYCLSQESESHSANRAEADHCKHLLNLEAGKLKLTSNPVVTESNDKEAKHKLPAIHSPIGIAEVGIKKLHKKLCQLEERSSGGAQNRRHTTS